MKTWGSGSIALDTLSRSTSGGEWSVSCPGRFNLWERTPGIHCIGGWVGPRGGMDTVEKRKISRSCRKSNPVHLVRSPSLKSTELSRIQESKVASKNGSIEISSGCLIHVFKIQASSAETRKKREPFLEMFLWKPTKPVNTFHLEVYHFSKVKPSDENNYHHLYKVEEIVCEGTDWTRLVQWRTLMRV
jgi:hypothetical protein